MLLPYLLDPAAALSTHPALGYRVTVYADVPFGLGERPHCAACDPSSLFDSTSQRIKHWGSCPPVQPQFRKLAQMDCTAFCNCTCDAAARECPMYRVYSRLHAIHAKLNAQMSFLSTLE